VLHGAMVSKRFPWDRMARQLAERDIEALVPSMPDHFERTPSGEYSGQYLLGGAVGTRPPGDPARGNRRADACAVAA